MIHTMEIHAYCILRNEARILPYFFRHYDKFVTEYFMYDDDSDDGTRELILANPKAHLVPIAMKGLDDIMFSELYRDEYKKRSRGKADWCLALAADEFIYHPTGVESELEVYMEMGYDVLRTQGYQMISDHFPDKGIQIYQEIKTGTPDLRYSLAVIFNPMVDVAFGPGREETLTSGRMANMTPLKLLHYRFLGEEYTRERHARNFSRLTQRNLENGYGVHTSPDYHGTYDLDWFREELAEARPCLG